MTVFVQFTQSPQKSLPLERWLWLSRSKDVHGREGMSSDILYNSSCYQRRTTLLDVPLQVWMKFYPNITVFFFPRRMCSLGFKGEMVVIPLNRLSLWVKMFSRKCVEVLAVELLLIFFFSSMLCYSWWTVTAWQHCKIRAQFIQGVGGNGVQSYAQ